MMMSIESIRDANLSVPELHDQINVRQTLISEMVGQLYPMILRDEIREIYQFIHNKKAGSNPGLSHVTSQVA
jgi:hypothetical protein